MSDFKVQGQLGLDGSGFFSTLGKAEGAVGKIGGLLAGAFSVGAITAFSKSVLDLAGKLNDVSEALSLNVEFLQKFANSAAKSGGGIGDIEKFIFESNKSRQEAVNDPKGKAATAFNRLGFTQDDISRLNPQQFIEKLITAFQNGADAQDINALAEIGGKSAKKLVGAFKDGLDEQTAIINEQLVSQLDEVGDKFTSIGVALKSTFAPVLGMVANVIESTFDKIALVVAFYTEFIARLLSGSGFGAAKREAAKARDELAEQQKKDKASRAAALAAKRDAKNETDAESPNFTPDADAKKAKEISAKTYSDSRLAVGGFLGGGQTNKLANLAERQLQVAAQTLDVQKALLAYIKNPANLPSLIIPL